MNEQSHLRSDSLKRCVAVILTVIAVLALTLEAANADYTYVYVPKFSTYNLDGTLIVTDAAVASGSMDFELYCIGGPFCLAGDDSGLVSLTVGNNCCLPDTFTPTHDVGRAIVNVAFNADGTLTGEVVGLGISNGLTTFGTEFGWIGGWDSDTGTCPDALYNQPSRFECLDPGYWYSAAANLPEPPSLWLLLAGLLVLTLGKFLIRGPTTFQKSSGPG